MRPIPFSLLLTISASTVAALALSPAAARAGDRVEITPTFGFRTNPIAFRPQIFCLPVIGSNCPDRADVDGAATFGLTVDVPINERWMFELRIDRQSSDVDVPPLVEGFGVLVFVFDEEIESTALTVGGLRSWSLGRVEPFVAFGIGITSIDLDRFTIAPRGLEGDHLTLGVGGGVKLFPERRFGLRLEARGAWVDLPSAFDDGIAGEISSGLIVRF